MRRATSEPSTRGREEQRRRGPVMTSVTRHAASQHLSLVMTASSPGSLSLVWPGSGLQLQVRGLSLATASEARPSPGRSPASAVLVISEPEPSSQQ